MKRTLYHFELCPFSRKVRVMLSEKGLEYGLCSEPYWKRREEFLAINPAGEVPVLVESEGHLVIGHYAIAEFLEEKYPKNTLLGSDFYQRAEIRRLVQWFEVKCYKEAVLYILHERMLRFFTHRGEPQSSVIRAAKTNLQHHLYYIEYLLKQHKWLAGNHFTLADVAAACQLSILDYFSDVQWEKFSLAKEWYALIKSRPSFKGMLHDRISGFTPPSHYVNPDF